MGNYNLSTLLPHKPPMIFLDDIIDINLENQTLTAKFTVTPDKVFFDSSINGISSIVGIEFMAQAVGCYAYYRNKCSKPRPGLLLGSRLYNNIVDKFENGETYIVKTHEVFTDNEIVVFDCLIYDKENNEIQSSTVKTYQGEKMKDLLKFNE